MSGSKILIADLNNFSRYPTLSVGYLAASAREAGHHVEVFSPLAIGVSGVVREPPATTFSLWTEKLNFRMAHSRSPGLKAARSWAGENLLSAVSRHSGKVYRAFLSEFDRVRPDCVLISSYLMYKGLVEMISSACHSAGVPVLVGGPYFAEPEVVEEWVSIPGVVGLAAGELELRLPRILEALMGEGTDAEKAERLSSEEGILVPSAGGGYTGQIARPLKDLSPLPIPDFSDFPWDKYPDRIAPILAGRGCGWGVCTFCSDVTGTAGRTFRSRPPSAVLREVQSQYESLGTSLFVFTDMKLNSDLDLWHTLISKMRDVAPTARWIASVHAGDHGDSGLSRAELQAAAESGCVRLTTGLESGSQRMLDLMKKGTTLEGVREYLSSAHEAGISTRATMISGYPGETYEDVEASARFVEDHVDTIERIKLCAFTRTVGTSIDRQLRKADSEGTPVLGRAYRRATNRLIEAVHKVNSSPLPEHAAVFEGVM